MNQILYCNVIHTVRNRFVGFLELDESGLIAERVRCETPRLTWEEALHDADLLALSLLKQHGVINREREDIYGAYVAYQYELPLAAMGAKQ